MLKSKTVWTGIAGIVTAAGGYYTGALAPAEAMQLGFVSLQTIFLRAGVAKATGG
jgi:hypothetical protein